MSAFDDFNRLQQLTQNSAQGPKGNTSPFAALLSMITGVNFASPQAGILPDANGFIGNNIPGPFSILEGNRKTPPIGDSFLKSLHTIPGGQTNFSSDIGNIGAALLGGGNLIGGAEVSAPTSPAMQIASIRGGMEMGSPG